MLLVRWDVQRPIASFSECCITMKVGVMRISLSLLFGGWDVSYYASGLNQMMNRQRLINVDAWDLMFLGALVEFPTNSNEKVVRMASELLRCDCFHSCALSVTDHVVVEVTGWLTQRLPIVTPCINQHTTIEVVNLFDFSFGNDKLSRLISLHFLPLASLYDTQKKKKKKKARERDKTPFKLPNKQPRVIFFFSPFALSSTRTAPGSEGLLVADSN